MSDRTEASEEIEAVPPVTREELATRVEVLEGTVERLNGLLSSFMARTLRTVEELQDDIGHRTPATAVQSIEKELEKVRARIEHVADEVGYGQALDIAKVPPVILEASYQGTLDDIVEALKDARGTHDAEQHVVQSLEEVRKKTSGSELFHYAPHRITVRVAKPLEKGLVSARQVQMTFDELLRHLLEPIHRHRPPNFRGLIKIKSQEYAVEKALALGKASDQAGPRLQTLDARVQRVEEQVTGALRDVQDLVARLEPLLAGAATQESVEALSLRITDLEGRLRRGLAPSGNAHATVAAPPSTLADRILSALAIEPRTLAALRKELDVDDAELRAALQDLEHHNRITTSVRGRTTTYRTKEATDDA